MKKVNIIYASLITVLFLGVVNVNAQEQKPDTLAKAIEQLQSDVSWLKNLKISGYIQAQAQFADSLGAKTDMNGGAFNSGSDKRFAIRRGRLKFVYSSNPLSQYAMQIDVTEAGVKTKEVYAKFTEPFLKTFSLTAGLQNRPFGFEVEYSSGLLESPERARMNQSLFKDEYDLGAMLTIQAPKTSPWNCLKLDAGLFSGSIENNNPMDYKRNKDFIGRLNFSKTYLEETLKVSGDLSYYNGGVTDYSSKLYTVQNNGAPAFTSQKVDSLSNGKREYYGADLQISYASPIGLTTIRGEYTTGQQASLAGDIKNSTVVTTYTNNPSTNVVTAKTSNPVGPLYIRKVSGYYVMLVQNVGQTRHSFVVKYDVFDPNTSVSGSEITKANGFSSVDVKYSDLGLGYICRIDANTKLTLYYDINKNESTGLSGLTKDLKDNVWTIRLQYKF